MKKRVLAILLCLVMALSLIPVGAAALGTEPESGSHAAHEGWTALGDVYTLAKGDPAISRVDLMTLTAPVEETPEVPVETPAHARTTVLIVFGSLLAVAAVLTVVAILAVKKMKKKNAEK